MLLVQFLELAHRKAHREWVRAAAKLSLSHSEFEYLSAIRDQESYKTDKDNHGQHLQDVVEAMGVRKASASAMVLKLEERGLVERVDCQYDARAQHILLTKEGRTLLKQGDSIYATVMAQLMSELPADDLHAVADEMKAAANRS
ncbi:hypothetical protein MXMO3_01349 [Maritalea myrionectae]|uniref:HTH marR-type domain-containing protein n=1 Tax=Maritalea myrionectae TaxID=454601 RepID=A0A2R4MD02_9HYPH|nr:MarR family transcriptional regulator [Maritalea myrionectae]AVX03880.1 hypothetical protein MXMO3_01349 [Maritalea myrionectae]